MSPPIPVKQLIHGYIQPLPAVMNTTRVDHIEMRNSQGKNPNKPKKQIKVSKYFFKLNTDSSSQTHDPKRANDHSLSCGLTRPGRWRLKRRVCQAGAHFPVSHFSSSEHK